MKIGDRVEIINPEMWVRTGYKHTTKDALELLNSSSVSSVRSKLLSMFPFLDRDLAYSKIEHLIGSAYNAQTLKFGGSERSVFTETVPEYKGRFGVITETKRTISGVRIEGGYESYLSKQKCHIMHRIEFIDGEADQINNASSRWWNVDLADTDNKYTHGMNWFESKNLELAIPGPV